MVVLNKKEDLYFSATKLRFYATKSESVIEQISGLSRTSVVASWITTCAFHYSRRDSESIFKLD